MIKDITLLLFLAFYFIEAFSTSIVGIDTNYSNTEIILLKQADPFSGKEEELCRTRFDENGSFIVEPDIDKTTYVFFYLGVHKAFLFIEPGKDYKIVLPRRKDKVEEDNFNPFFEYIETHLGVINSDQNELNQQIRMFLDSYNAYFNKHTMRVFSNSLEFDQLNKDIEQLDKPYSKSKNEFFNEYRKYKYGMLRFIAYQHKSKSVSDIYFKGQRFLENNPAFVELFNMVYEDYFSYFTRTEEGKKLVLAINSKSYSKVKNVLSKDAVLQPEELLNMVLLKSLHKEFYDDNYSRSAMLTVLDSLILVSNNLVETKTAKNIRQKVTKLLTGFKPPSFELYDIDSNLVSLDNFKGKFIYLNFCSCFSYTCINEFAMLQNLHKKHSKYLEIITVVIDKDAQVVKDFVLRSGYEWTFLQYDNSPNIFKDYDIRSFPTYYLIDNEGKLSMSPAPAPAEEFEGRLFKVLRAKGIL